MYIQDTIEEMTDVSYVDDMDLATGLKCPSKDVVIIVYSQDYLIIQCLIHDSRDTISVLLQHITFTVYCMF